MNRFTLHQHPHCLPCSCCGRRTVPPFVLAWRTRCLDCKAPWCLFPCLQSPAGPEPVYSPAVGRVAR